MDSSIVPKLVIPTPPAMAKAMEDGMYAKATKPIGELFWLALTGGAYIALGFIFFVTTQQGVGPTSGLPIGVTKLIGGLVFSTGLMLVVMSGSDLFTGTTMSLMPTLSKRLSWGMMARHWAVSYIGNLVGALIVVAIIALAKTPLSNGGAWGLVVVNTTQGKLSLGFVQAIALGVMANFAVCLAVWMAFAGRSATDKMLGIAGPIAFFVATGFEHSVANMFMLPMGWVITHVFGAEFWGNDAVQAAGVTQADFSSVTISNIVLHNLLPVTIGNIIGGALFVGGYFWVAYRRKALAEERAAAPAEKADGVDRTDGGSHSAR